MSARLFRGATRRDERTRIHARVLLVLAAAVGLGGVFGVMAYGTTPPAYAASASITPSLYYIGDSAGSNYTFTVKNTGTSVGIGAVQVTRPNTNWTIIGCSAPAGWSAQQSSTMCRYRSSASQYGIAPKTGSKQFVVKARTAAGNVDIAGTWPVVVSRTNHFDNPSLIKYATPSGTGLTTKAHTFELTTAVVSATAKVPGTLCPPANKEAIVGSTRTIVVCGRNRANVALTPSSAYSSLAGTFVKTKGTFSSGLIPARSANVVLAQWTGTEVTDVFGSGKKIVTQIGARKDRTSPVRTFTGYFATSSPPVANADAYETDEDTPLTVPAPGVLSNDTDAESDPLTAVDVTNPSHGTLAANADGSFTYTPNADFHGTDTFTYKAFDTYTKSGAATVTITVKPVNDAPVAQADAANAGEDSTGTSIPVLGNDSDVDGDTLAVSAVDTTGTTGTVTNDGTGVTFKPDASHQGLGNGQTATTTFTYTVSDGAGGTDTETVTVTIVGTNDAPAAADDAYETDEATQIGPLSVLGNDTDAEGAVTITAVSTPTAGGTVTNNNDGTVTFNPAGAFEDLAAGEDRTTTFTYTVTDAQNATDTATVTVKVTGINDAPDAVADTPTVPEDSDGQVVDVLANDTDAEGQTLTVTAIDTTGTTGTVTNNGTDVTYDPNGMFESLGSTPGTDSFTYTISDGAGGTDTVTVTVTITGDNDAPVATDDAYSTDEATQIGPLSILGNDTDAEGPVTLTSVSATSNGGTVTNNNDGTVTFNPAGAFEALAAGQQDTTTFTYTVTDAGSRTDTATVTITVTGVNDAPVGTDDAKDVGEDSTGDTVLVLANDTDAESQTLTVSAVDTTGTTGTVTNNGTDVTYDPNGQFAYLGNNQTATDTFTYTVSDSQGATDTATVTITIVGSNDAPTATDDAYSTDEATQVGPLSVLINDTDAEAGVTLTSVSATTNGGTVTNNDDGTVTFNPNGAFEGLAAGEDDTTTFTYTVTDAQGATDTATVTITVNGINDAPAGNDDTKNVGEASTGDTVLVLANDPDAEGQTLSVSAVDTTGTVGTVTNNGGTHVTYDPNGQFEYLDDTETATDTFTYTVSDGNGGTDTATVTITITGANDAPVATDDGPFQTFTDQNLMLTTPGVLTNDTDADGEALTAGNASDPAHGTVTLDPDGSFSYTPDSGYNGSDTFTYDVSDGTATDTATVTITVVPPNATPTADATSASGDEDGGAFTVTLTGHDADGDALTFTAGTATNGLITVPAGTSCDSNVPSVCTATVTYTPGANFNGTDSFTYTVNDGTLDSQPATATVTVDAVNDAPSFTKGANQTVNEDVAAQSVTGWATAISKGPANESGQAVSFLVTNDDNALFATQPTVTSTGTLEYLPASDANGVATVSVRIQDDGGTANGGADTSPVQTFTITVNAVNDVPSFTKGADQTLLEDAGAQSVSNWATAISKGPADESAQTVSFTTSNDNNGLFSLQPGVTPTGTLTYTPAPDAVGSATVTISLSDTGGTLNGGDDTSDSQTFTITVNPVNDAPSFTTAGNQTVLEDAGAQTVNGFVTGTSAGPSDESGQTVTVAVSNVTNPTLFSVAPSITNGNLTYTPAANANGASTVTVGSTDSGGTANGGVDASPTQTFTITVSPVNDAPSFTKGADQTLNEDAGAQSVSNWATAISKGPADESAQTVSFAVTNNNNALFATQPTVSSTGTLTYTSAANKYGTATVTLSISDSGGTTNGGDDTSDTQTFTITVNPVNDAPVAATKSYTVHSNMKISLGGLLTGATDPNDVAGDATWSPTFTLGSITPGAGCVGCTISNVNNANGTFDFEPPAGQTGTFTVDYTVVDNGHPVPGATSAAQTITFTVSGDIIWFADAVNGVDGAGRGTLTRPFKTLAAVSAVDLASQKVFAYSGTYSDAITLLNGEWLTGAGAKGADFDTLMGITPPAGTVGRPAINGTNPTLSGNVTLGSGNTLRGLTLTGASALSGSNFGTLTLGNNTAVTTDVAINTAGQALSLTTGTVAGDLTSVSSSGGTNNVLLSSVSSTGTSLGNGALSGATADGFRVTGGNGTFSYSGTVGNGSATGAVVSVSNKTGGTVTLSGAITSTAGPGVSLTNNGGATVNLTAGGMTLTSTTSPAFVATGGGTVTVTGAGNTITSTTGTPVTISGTTIGANDVTFRSVSANGAANGIVLSSTGSSGNFVVTGNGGTCTLANTSGCTGGTISNVTGGDSSSTTPVGTGIVLNDTLAPSFTRMRIHDASNYAVRGTNVTGLALDSVTVNGTNGTNGNAPFSESSMLFDNLTGTAGFTNVEVSGGTNGNIEVNNTTGTLNSTFSALRLGSMSTTLGNDGLQVEGDGTATVNVTVQNSTFTSARGDQFQYIGNGTGGGTLNFTNNTLTNNHPAIATGGGGITLNAGQDGPVTMTVSNNTIRDALGNAYTIGKNPGSGSLTGTFSGNTIGVAGVANSGSLEGSGIRFAHQGTGTMSWNVTGNFIHQYNNYGMLMQSGDGVATGGNNHFNVSGNTISNPGTSNVGLWQGILVNSGVTPGDSFQTCVNFGANTITGAGRNGGHDIRVRQRQATTVRLPGYLGGPDDDAAAIGYVVGKVGGSPSNSATSDYPTTGGGWTGTGTTC